MKRAVSPKRVGWWIGLVLGILMAGRLPNTPDNLMQWVRHPQSVEPGNAMPNMEVTEEDARHIAAYLYTLR